MRLINALLLIADVSGYTHFIRHRAVSLAHAESIVTELLESVIDRAEHPLILNKLEGDAALLYAEVTNDPRAAVESAVGQAGAFFDAFTARRAEVQDARRHCSCDACTAIDGLGLKVFVHVGEVLLKPVRHFEELAGEEVILIHRLLKNHVPAREYVLLSQPVHDVVGRLLPECAAVTEDIEGLEPVTIWWLPPDAPGLQQLVARTVSPAAGPHRAVEPMRLADHFHHLPRYQTSTWTAAWEHVAILAGRWFSRR